MSRNDGPDGVGPDSLIDANGDDGVHADYLLFESLAHVLIEKGVLTKNDALSVIATVAQVKQGELHEGRRASAPVRAALLRLQRMYRSFEAVDERPRVTAAADGNVHQLRPPVHGDRPEFPDDD